MEHEVKPGQGTGYRGPERVPGGRVGVGGDNRTVLRGETCSQRTVVGPLGVVVK